MEYCHSTISMSELIHASRIHNCSENQGTPMNQVSQIEGTPAL